MILSILFAANFMCFLLRYSAWSGQYLKYFVILYIKSFWLSEEKAYSERTTSSEPSEIEDDEERRELEQEHVQLVMEEEELLATGQLCCNDT